MLSELSQYDTSRDIHDTDTPEKFDILVIDVNLSTWYSKEMWDTWEHWDAHDWHLGYLRQIKVLTRAKKIASLKVKFPVHTCLAHLWCLEITT